MTVTRGMTTSTIKSIRRILTNHQRFIAGMLNLNPNNEADWPMDLINKLISIDNEKGRIHVLKEIHELTTLPLRSDNEIIADMVVDQLISKGVFK